jgi:hypothetical protein
VPVFRYQEGDVIDVIKSMDVSPDTYIDLGGDGVVRAYARNGTVADFRQLDSGQIETVRNYLHPKNGNVLGRSYETPAPSQPQLDERKVTDINQLLTPREPRESFEGQTQTVSDEPLKLRAEADVPCNTIGCDAIGSPQFCWFTHLANCV